MDLIEFLRLFVPSNLGGVAAAGATVGGLIYACIEVWDKIGERLRRKPSGDAKFIAALGAAVVAPLAAAILLAQQTGEPFTANMAFLAVGVIAAVVSKIAHSAGDKLVGK